MATLPANHRRMCVVRPCQCFPQTVSVFLGPLSHSLLQLSMGLQTVGRATIPGPTATRRGKQQLWLSPPLLSTYIHQPFLCLCFDFLCIRPTMGRKPGLSFQLQPSRKEANDEVTIGRNCRSCLKENVFPSIFPPQPSFICSFICSFFLPSLSSLPPISEYTQCKVSYKSRITLGTRDVC